MNIEEMTTNIAFNLGVTEYERNDLRYQVTQDKIKELLTALHDAIKLNAGEVPESALPFFCDDEFKSNATRN